jgi:transposase InsO family protein
LGFLEVGFITGLIIAIKSLNATSTASSLIARFEKSLRIKGTRWCRRIQKELEENDVKTIAASMKRQSLVAKAARKFKCTTDSKHKLPVAPNLLEQDFNATAPNQK